MIKDIKRQQLEENYKLGGGHYPETISFKEWVKREANNDPNFFAWLFDAELDEDFDASLSEEQREEVREFVSNL